MSKFKAFMKGGADRVRTKNVYISDFFKDEQGNIVPFVIRSLGAKQEKAIRNSCMTVNEDTGMKVLDTTKYEDAITVACVVSPDLRDKDLQDSYGVIGEVALLGEMLLCGEYSKLQEEITKFNGFKSIEDKVKEAKN